MGRWVVPDRWMTKGEAALQLGKKLLVVWGGIRGEEAEIRVVGETRSQLHGTWVRAREPSPHRVEPICERYALCGGCPLMHVDTAGQVEARRWLVGSALRAAGLARLEVSSVHASPVGSEGYRHCIRLGFGLSDQGRIRLGTWARGTGRLVPIPGCHLVTPVLRQVMKSLAHHTIDLHIRPWDAETDQGVLRRALVRQSSTTGEVLITLVAGRRIRELQELAERVAGGVSAVTGVWLHVDTGPPQEIFLRGEQGLVGLQPLLGKEWIEERAGDIRVRVGPGDVFPSNPGVATLAQERALERLELAPGDSFVEVGSGAGGLALRAAQLTGWALGLEEIETAVTHARGAARAQGISAEFTHGRLLDLLVDLRRRLDGVRPVIAVPGGRRGLQPEELQGLLSLRPSKVLYTSEAPWAMARDLATLRDGGLQPGPVELFDSHPHSARVTTQVVLTAPDGGQRGRRAPRRKVVRRS